MKRLIIAAGAAAFLAITSVAAFAAQASGEIVSVDTKTNVVTLSDGKIYMVPHSVVPVSSLQVGNKVTITYTADPGTGQMQASAVVITLPDAKS